MSSGTASHSSEICDLRLTVATVELLYPKWFNHICGILADAHLLHTVSPSMCPPNPPHARTHAAAITEDPTLEAFTSIAETYYGFTETADTFPGTCLEQFKAIAIIHANVDCSYADSLPDTGFAYDIIQQIYHLYFSIVSHPPVVNKKLQAWFSLQMTATQSIADYWVTVCSHLSNLKELKQLPEVAPFVAFPHIKHHVIDRLHVAFGSIKCRLCSDDTICNELQLLMALLQRERDIHWTVSVDTPSMDANSRQETNNTTTTSPRKDRNSPYQRPPHALELRERPTTPCRICVAANTATYRFHWKNQCYRNPRYLEGCLKPLPPNITLIPFHRVGIAAQSHPDVIDIYESRSLLL
ncbi:hypothetical protein HDU77_000878 [Chytriomyces hyalinus]|nr:hypothetical protein HDU77_000878 [Chytriomyces hyalinus]